MLCANLADSTNRFVPGKIWSAPTVERARASTVKLRRLILSGGAFNVSGFTCSSQAMACRVEKPARSVDQSVGRGRIIIAEMLGGRGLDWQTNSTSNPRPTVSVRPKVFRYLKVEYGVLNADCRAPRVNLELIIPNSHFLLRHLQWRVSPRARPPSRPAKPCLPHAAGRD
jgi:hypothetical protein